MRRRLHAYKGRSLSTLTLLIALPILGGCGSVESREGPGDEAALNVNGLEGGTGDGRERAVPSAVPAGTNLTFRLSSSISTETHAEDDRFEATLVNDVTGPDGRTLIAAGTRAIGVVAVSEESPSDADPAVLELRLESIEVDGVSRRLPATTVSAEAASETRASGGESAAKIAVGAAAGAVVGRILGQDRRGALIGAGAGAVAGTALAITTDEGHARINEGSTITVVLDSPLEAS